MKLWSRSTLGVVVGSLNILAYAVASIILMRTLVRINDLFIPTNTTQFDLDLSKTAIALGNAILCSLLVLCFIMATLSGYLIKGIVKRRHVLMLPWLIISAICLICSSVRFIYISCISLAVGVPVSDVSVGIIVGCLIFGLQFLILYIIYRLFMDIRAKNIEKPLQTVRGGQMGYANAYQSQENTFDSFNGFNEVSPKY